MGPDLWSRTEERKQKRLANKQTRTLLPTQRQLLLEKKDSGVERSGRVKEKGSREKGLVS